MAQLTIQKVAEAGITPAYASATSGGDKVKNANGDIMLHVKNTNAATRTVTVTAQRTTATPPGMGSTTKANVAVVVPATTGDKMIGPFPTLAFNDAGNDLVISYDAVAGLTIAALRLPRAS